ncbi:hypothetical protein FACS1894176_06030 [Bacteroidia bacterium]|nr:hypothetical protein FACS1894176_06030 [Bacteroidia bacterium]
MMLHYGKRGKIANIYKANGALNSARAGQYANLSKALKITGVAGSGLMAYQGYSNIRSGDANALDYTDTGMGTIGFGAGLASAGGYAVPYVGQVAALYGWGRFWFDLGYNYGPMSTYLRYQENKRRYRSILWD